MPVWAYSLRMSTTSGPMLPWYTGRSTLGLPLLNDSVALLSASFIFCPFSSFLILCQQYQYFEHLGPIKFRVHLGQRFPAQMQIQQIVVAEIHQCTEPGGLAAGQTCFISVEESLYEDVIFQQTAAASPLELAEGPRVQQFVRHWRVPVKWPERPSFP